MARKEITLTLKDRGNPLTFRIREMPATKLEAWIIRAVLLLAGSGAEVPGGADIQKAGAYLASKGLNALGGIDYEKTKPLLDDLLTCCHRVLPQGGELAVTESTIDGFIEDVRTLFQLRVEVVKLNLGFFKIGDLSSSPSMTGTESGTPNT